MRVTLERLGQREWRQNPGQPPREHRLACPRRAGEKQVVAARCGDLERAAGPFLTADVREIGMPAVSARRARLDGGRVEAAAQVGGCLREVPDGDWLDSRKRGLGGRFVGAEETRRAGPASGLGGNDRARDGPHPPVQRQLAESRMLRKTLRRHLA
jgi:hypothetical protein